MVFGCDNDVDISSFFFSLFCILLSIYMISFGNSVYFFILFGFLVRDYELTKIDHPYIYIYIYICVCVCAYVRTLMCTEKEREKILIDESKIFTIYDIILSLHHTSTIHTIIRKYITKLLVIETLWQNGSFT